VAVDVLLIHFGQGSFGVPFLYYYTHHKPYSPSHTRGGLNTGKLGKIFQNFSISMATLGFVACCDCFACTLATVRF